MIIWLTNRGWFTKLLRFSNTQTNGSFPLSSPPAPTTTASVLLEQLNSYHFYCSLYRVPSPSYSTGPSCFFLPAPGWSYSPPGFCLWIPFALQIAKDTAKHPPHLLRSSQIVDPHIQLCWTTKVTWKEALCSRKQSPVHSAFEPTKYDHWTRAFTSNRQ